MENKKLSPKLQEALDKARHADAAASQSTLSDSPIIYLIGSFPLAAIGLTLYLSWFSKGAPELLMRSSLVSLGLWLVLYHFARHSHTSMRERLTTSLSFIVSLISVAVSCGAIVMALGWSNPYVHIVIAAGLLVLAFLHLGIYKFIRQKIILLIAIFLIVSSIPLYLTEFLLTANLPSDIWSILIIVPAFSLPIIARLLAKKSPDKVMIRYSFDSLSVFIALATMYISSFSQSTGLVWACLIIYTFINTCRWGIKTRNIRLFNIGAFFLILTAATIPIVHPAQLADGTAVGFVIGLLCFLGAFLTIVYVKGKYNMTYDVHKNLARENGFIILSIIIGFLCWAGWIGTSDEMESLANQFKADTSWQLTGEHVERPQSVPCFDVSCPSISREWSARKPVTQAEVVDIVKRSGWDKVKVDKNCNQEGHDSLFVCSLGGTLNGYEVAIYIDNKPSESMPYTVSLFIY